MNDADLELVLINSDLSLANGKMRRTIEQVLNLLMDADHALAHGSPEVTAEFLDRSIGSLLSLI